ncbi:MAG: ImmA/IrrE family metallo-endopeptidase [Thermaerobacter sp.]|nr:ImmA/IrrE family metallo-endopeptidase [Thermaerobacter sp.]
MLGGQQVFYGPREKWLREAQVMHRGCIPPICHPLIEIMDDTGQDGWTVRNQWTGNYACFINPEMPRKRVRWTMAHELGHIILGHIDGDEGDEERPTWMEREANVFAEELLMPWEFFEGCSFRNVQGWAAHMEVSQEACAWRLLQIPKVYPASGKPWLGLADVDFISGAVKPRR